MFAAVKLVTQGIIVTSFEKPRVIFSALLSSILAFIKYE